MGRATEITRRVLTDGLPVRERLSRFLHEYGKSEKEATTAYLSTLHALTKSGDSEVARVAQEAFDDFNAFSITTQAGDLTKRKLEEMPPRRQKRKIEKQVLLEKLVVANENISTTHKNVVDAHRNLVDAHKNLVDSFMRAKLNRPPDLESAKINRPQGPKEPKNETHCNRSLVFGAQM